MPGRRFLRLSGNSMGYAVSTGDRDLGKPDATPPRLLAPGMS